MDYYLATFDGYYFAHVAAWLEHQRLGRIARRVDAARRGGYPGRALRASSPNLDGRGLVAPAAS